MERRSRSYSFFTAPRTFMREQPDLQRDQRPGLHVPRPDHPQDVAGDEPPEAVLRAATSCCDATSQAANSVTAMAGHWSASSSVVRSSG